MDKELWAIDPGEIHVGVAKFWPLDDLDHTACIWAGEMQPAEAIVAVREGFEQDRIGVLVVEEYRLYPHRMAKQVWSRLLTVELIGVFRYLWTLQGTQGQPEAKEGPRKASEDGEALWVEQPALIKKPTQGILKARGVRSTAKRLKAGGHALDAELHGWHWLLRRKEALEQERVEQEKETARRLDKESSPMVRSRGRAVKTATKKG